MSSNTTPDVGTIMKRGELCTEVLLASHEYMVARDEDGWRRALQLINGKWCDNSNSVWEIEEPEPPTLQVGTVLTHGVFTLTVVGAAPGFALAVDADGDRWALAVDAGGRWAAVVWIDNAWRTTPSGTPWEVRP